MATKPSFAFIRVIRGGIFSTPNCEVNFPKEGNMRKKFGFFGVFQCASVLDIGAFQTPSNGVDRGFITERKMVLLARLLTRINGTFTPRKFEGE